KILLPYRHAQEVWPYYDTKNDFPPDQFGEGDGEKPAGEPEKRTCRASSCPSVMPMSFFLCHIVLLSTLTSHLI
ncbi:MAG TPA: hypothetical protein VMW00_03645, partial [Dehalococcoidales bacterium]|nr:hypothetical protein [Dehalococcoidales bacterium]